MLRLDVYRDVPDRLNRIGVEENAVLLAELADLGYRLDGADLVVGGHYRDEAGVLAYRRLQFICFYNAVFVNGQKRDVKAVFL